MQNPTRRTLTLVLLSLVRPHPVLRGNNSKCAVSHAVTEVLTTTENWNKSRGKDLQREARSWLRAVVGACDGGKEDKIILRDLSEDQKLPVTESVQFAYCLADPSGHRGKHNYICSLI